MASLICPKKLHGIQLTHVHKMFPLKTQEDQSAPLTFFPVQKQNKSSQTPYGSPNYNNTPHFSHLTHSMPQKNAQPSRNIKYET